MAMSTGFGNRRFPRLEENLAALVRCTTPWNVEGLYRTSTLGMGGCELVGARSFGVGSTLDALLSLEGRVIRFKGRVVYERWRPSGSLGIGVEFRRLDNQAKELLESFFALEGALTTGTWADTPEGLAC